MDNSQIPKFGKLALRFPTSRQEADRVYDKHWNKSAKRKHWLLADVILDSGEYLRHVEFDGRGIVLRVNVRHSNRYPHFLNKRVKHWIAIASTYKGQHQEWATVTDRFQFARKHDRTICVNQLPVPPALISLIEVGNWKHPGDDVIKNVIPFRSEFVGFMTIDEMERNASGLGWGDTEKGALCFKERRGTDTVAVPDLPWRDMNKSFFIATDREHGSVGGIALDFRAGPEGDPRVIANASGLNLYEWRLVTNSFSEFLQRIGLSP